MSDALAGLYQQVILDHSKLRTGFGQLDEADAERFERNPSCGDEITLQLALEPGTDRVRSLAWSGAGCSISQASASVLAGLAPGLTTTELQSTIDAFREMMRSRGIGDPDEDVLGDAVVFQGVSKFVMRVKCAMLAWVAAEGCLADVAAAR
ncbi:Fe-S cluster assembly sulfur transfer protein SufU [Glaciibacter psychrotolerans]|nr:SUF system NifU family Fe-S cluster assembly protein [Leifsonia psychrotolerans]